MEEPLRSKGSRYLNLFSCKIRADIQEGLNGCVTDSLSESLWQLSILCDLHFILGLNSMDVNQRKAVTVFLQILTRWFKATEPQK